MNEHDKKTTDDPIEGIAEEPKTDRPPPDTEPDWDPGGLRPWDVLIHIHHPEKGTLFTPDAGGQVTLDLDGQILRDTDDAPAPDAFHHWFFDNEAALIGPTGTITPTPAPGVHHVTLRFVHPAPTPGAELREWSIPIEVAASLATKPPPAQAPPAPPKPTFWQQVLAFLRSLFGG